MVDFRITLTLYTVGGNSDSRLSERLVAIRRSLLQKTGQLIYIIHHIHDHADKKLSGLVPVFEEQERLGMQIAFGRVRRKTAPTGSGVKTGPKNGKPNGLPKNRHVCPFPGKRRRSP